MNKKLKKLVLSLLLVCLFILGGCSKKSEQVKKKTIRAIDEIKLPKLSDTRSEEYKENSFKTLNGNIVKYNMNTRKIVCIDGSHDLVAFGITPLAYEGTTDISGYEEFYEGSSMLDNYTPFSSEEVLSYEPELILVNQRMIPTNIKALEKIAPVIPVYSDSTDFAQRLTYIGKIFGLEEHAEKLIDYAEELKEAMLKEMRKLNLQDKTLTLFTYLTAISIIPERGWFMNVILYDYLNIKRLKKVTDFMRDESGLAYEAISSEKLKDYEGDLVLFASLDNEGIPDYVKENVGWQQLNAVKENRVAVFKARPYAQKGVILLYEQYMQLFDALKKAAKLD